MSPRIRPRLIDWQMARDLEWLEQHWNLIEWCPWNPPGEQWIVYASEDVHEDGIHAQVASLGEAIRVARELLEGG